MHMDVLVKAATIAAGIALSSQPCLAAAVESKSKSAAVTAAASTAQRDEFNLKMHVETAAAQKQASQFALATSVSANAAFIAQESEERDRRGMSKGVQTALIVGGVALLAIVVLAVVASGTPTAGPPPGAF
jgi:hypothetical protein